MKRSGCFALVIGLLLCASLVLNLVLFFVAVGKMKAPAGMGMAKVRHTRVPLQETTLLDAEDSKNKIALVNLNGVITSGDKGSFSDSMVEDVKLLLNHAIEDARVKAIIVNIDSPGGEVTASDVLYKAISDARAKKPVVIYMGSMATSGGYYAACGGNYLMASETSITGSIGVIIQTFNYRELLGKVGLDAMVFKSGKFKDILSGSREMTEEERAYIQSLVMQTYGRFVGIVAKERKLDEAKLREGMADGRILSGTDAKEAGLIDGLGYIEDAYERARSLAGDPGAAVIKYEVPFSFSNLFGFAGEAKGRGREVKLSLLPETWTALEQGRMYLLPAHFAR